MITIKLLIWLIPIGLNIWVDAKGRKPNYSMMFSIRGAIAIAYQFLLIPKGLMPWTLTSWQLLSVIFPVLVFQVTSFWIIFELSLNIIQKRSSLLYYDHKEKDSGWIDKFFAWAGTMWHTMAKIASLILMILSIIVIYQNYGTI